LKTKILSIALAALTAMSSAHAVVIDETTFKYYGGNMANVQNSLKTSNNTLRSFSYEKPWLAVGLLNTELGQCTATWLGQKDGWSYLLTASHCFVPDNTKAAPKTTVRMKFTGPNSVLLASGTGTAYVPPQRSQVAATAGFLPYDIAIVQLPTVATPVDNQGKPIEAPLLNDRFDESGRDLILVGYGRWGVGSVGVDGDPLAMPSSGERRLYGRSRITSVNDSGYSLYASYQAAGPSAYWGRTAPGDSGSALWQMRDSKPVIVATLYGGNTTTMAGPRIANYVSWIKSIVPGVRALADNKPQGCIVSVASGQKYCLQAGQSAGYSLPSWIYAQDVYVDATPGTAVYLSDMDNLSGNRVAGFVGTFSNARLKKVRAQNGQDLDFSRPKSMSVTANSTPVACILSMRSAAKYCMQANVAQEYSLPSWVNSHEVQVQAPSGLAVKLSDWDNLSYNRVATFPNLIQNYELKKVKAWSGETLDFSRPKSMNVVQQ
jgi:hypothetical protein